MGQDQGKGQVLKAFKAAFPLTSPILASFLFLGISYGLYATSCGFSFVYPMMMSLLIFGGSLEFVAVSMLMGAFAPLQTLIVALAIQARHIFYGLAMLRKYEGTGWKKAYLIFGMCDETFSINCFMDAPEGVDRAWFMVAVTVLNQFYWVLGATLGGLAGSMLTFDTAGLEFVMTALFVVIFLEQCLKEKQHISAVVGVACSVACLLFFGSEGFIIPTLLCILCFLTVLRKPISRRLDG